MELSNLRVGFALTGSFCTISSVLPEIKKLVELGVQVFPIVSEIVANSNTRFTSCEKLLKDLEEMTGNKPWLTIPEVEPIGPKKIIDALIIAPCTGNTLSKISNGITDTVVTMACKANLRNCRPVVMSIASNDALGANLRNIGTLMNSRDIYFVPFGQDDPVNKSKSLVSNQGMIIPTLVEALNGRQIQPLLFD